MRWRVGHGRAVDAHAVKTRVARVAVVFEHAHLHEAERARAAAAARHRRGRRRRRTAARSRTRTRTEHKRHCERLQSISVVREREVAEKPPFHVTLIVQALHKNAQQVGTKPPIASSIERREHSILL